MGVNATKETGFLMGSYYRSWTHPNSVLYGTFKGFPRGIFISCLIYLSLGLLFYPLMFEGSFLHGKQQQNDRIKELFIVKQLPYSFFPLMLRIAHGYDKTSWISCLLNRSVPIPVNKLRRQNPGVIAD